MYPEDVYPESGCRLPLPTRHNTDEVAQLDFDKVANPAGGTIRGLKGPGGIQLHSPKLSQYSRPLNNYLRHDTGFSGRVREITILTAARSCDSQFEWAAHEPEALRQGVPQAIIEIVKHNRGTEGLDEADAIIIELGREAFGARKVAPATFARALKQFGPAKLVDLISLMGNYVATAALLATFDMQLDPGQPPLLPVPAPR